MNNEQLPAPASSFAQVVEQLDLTEEMRRLSECIQGWLDETDTEMREALQWQFGGGSKYFRPMTVFSCFRANCGQEIPDEVIHRAMIVELFHNMSLIVDDILDESPERRGKTTLHTKFGNLSALMVSGYITADAFELTRHDPSLVSLFAKLVKRLGVAECRQWRLRRQPLGIEDWRSIAGEDTGSMFEICACLGDRTEQLRQFGHLLGVLYHGCDDVADVRGSAALGGGGAEDLRDGILTLPAALAIRSNAEVARMFANGHPEELETLGTAIREHIDEAEHYLDQIAEEAKKEAIIFATDPSSLYALVDHTRKLSSA